MNVPAPQPGRSARQRQRQASRCKGALHDLTFPGGSPLQTRYCVHAQHNRMCGWVSPLGFSISSSSSSRPRAPRRGCQSVRGPAEARAAATCMYMPTCMYMFVVVVVVVTCTAWYGLRAVQRGMHTPHRSRKLRSVYPPRNVLSLCLPDSMLSLCLTSLSTSPSR